MKQHKIILRYILEKSKIRQNGKAPLYGRITYLGKRKQFSTGLFVRGIVQLIWYFPLFYFFENGTPKLKIGTP